MRSSLVLENETIDQQTDPRELLLKMLTTDIGEDDLNTNNCLSQKPENFIKKTWIKQLTLKTTPHEKMCLLGCPSTNFWMR
jgi:hypothetical protein